MVVRVEEREFFTEFNLNDHIYISANDTELEMFDGYMCIVTEHWLPENPECVIISGRNILGVQGEWGTYTEYITRDYTSHIRKVIAAHRIQATWRAYKLRKLREKSAEIIQISWQNWLVRKNEVWNPYTLVGITDMMINFIRLHKNC